MISKNSWKHSALRTFCNTIIIRLQTNNEQPKRMSKDKLSIFATDKLYLYIHSYHFEHKILKCRMLKKIPICIHNYSAFALWLAVVNLSVHAFKAVELHYS